MITSDSLVDGKLSATKSIRDYSPVIVAGASVGQLYPGWFVPQEVACTFLRHVLSVAVTIAPPSTKIKNLNGISVSRQRYMVSVTSRFPVLLLDG